MKYYIIILLFLKTLCLSDLFGQYSPERVEKLGSHINLADYDEISPIVTPDGRTLYFTRVGYDIFDRTLLENDIDISKTIAEREYISKLRSIYSEIAGTEIIRPVSSNINQDIWVALTGKSLFDRIVHPSYPLNNALPNSVCGISGDKGQYLIVINQFSRSGGMFQGFSKVYYNENLGWQFPEPLYIDGFNIKGTEVSLTSSLDEEVIILSFADTPGDRDLFVSFKKEGNLYSEPRNLGSRINSPYKDFSPFLTSDKRFILFSSDRSDPNSTNSIYISERLDDSWTNWSEPKALPSPINSSASEQHPFLNEKYMMLYFTSNRDGSNDIFRTRIIPDSLVKGPGAPAVTEARNKQQVQKEILKLKVFNSGNRKPEVSRIRIKDKESGNTFIIDARNGEAELNCHNYNHLELSAEKEGFFSTITHFDKSTSQKDSEGNFYLRLTLDPLRQGSTLSLNPIHFQRGTDRLLPESYPELERIAELLKRYPDIKILVVGHTDSVGDKEALLHLSENRAYAVKRFLENKGIKGTSIETTGKGAEVPLNDNTTEEKRARNRRVEFIIQ